MKVVGDRRVDAADVWDAVRELTETPHTATFS
jgi:hypothetical protein